MIKFKFYRYIRTLLGDKSFIKVTPKSKCYVLISKVGYSEEIEKALLDLDYLEEKF